MCLWVKDNFAASSIQIHKILKIIIILILILAGGNGNSQTNTILKSLDSGVVSKVRNDLRNGFHKFESPIPPLYERYKGAIVEKSDNWIGYDGWMIEVFCARPLRMIFLNGLIYPAVFGGPNNGEIWRPLVLPDSMAEAQKEFIRAVSLDSAHITLVQELPHKVKNINFRSFYFHLYTNNLMNLTEYSFGLINLKANEKTSLEEFIKGANLLYLKMDGIRN